MMRGAAGDFRQLMGAAEVGVELVTLGLGAVVLPVGGELVGEGVGELFAQGAGGIEGAEGGHGAGVPEDAAVLLAGAADALDITDRAPVVPQPTQHQLERVEPHRHRGVHLALGIVGLDALLDAISGPEIGIEIDLGFRHYLEVRSDHDSYIRGREGSHPVPRQPLCPTTNEALKTVTSKNPVGTCHGVSTAYVPLSCWVERSKPKYNGPEPIFFPGYSLAVARLRGLKDIYSKSKHMHMNIETQTGRTGRINAIIMGGDRRRELGGKGGRKLLSR